MLTLPLSVFAQAGFALLTCGLVRRKNAAHLVMLTLAAYATAMLAYVVAGCAVEFHRGVLLRGIALDAALAGRIALLLVAGYIIVGAVCERVTFGAFVLAELVLGALVFPLASR